MNESEPPGGGSKTTRWPLAKTANAKTENLQKLKTGPLQLSCQTVFSTPVSGCFAGSVLASILNFEKLKINYRRPPRGPDRTLKNNFGNGIDNPGPVPVDFGRSGQTGQTGHKMTTQQIEKPSDLLTTGEFARLASCSRRTVTRWVENLTVPSIAIERLPSKRIRIRRWALDLISNSEPEPPEDVANPPRN